MYIPALVILAWLAIFGLADVFHASIIAGSVAVAVLAGSFVAYARGW